MFVFDSRFYPILVSFPNTSSVTLFCSPFTTTTTQNSPAGPFTNSFSLEWANPPSCEQKSLCCITARLSFTVTDNKCLFLQPVNKDIKWSPLLFVQWSYGECAIHWHALTSGSMRAGQVIGAVLLKTATDKIVPLVIKFSRAYQSL